VLSRFVAQPNGKKGEDAIDTLVSQISSKELATLTRKLETLPFVRDVDVVRRTVTSRSDRVGIG
jgi:hypothetical protein